MLDVQSRTSESQIAQESKSTPIFEVEDLHLHYLTRFGDKIPLCPEFLFPCKKVRFWVWLVNQDAENRLW